jgi:RyR domain
LSLADAQIAEIMHEAHRAYQRTLPLYKTHMMPAPPWETMTRWQKQTVIGQVEGIRDDIEVLGWRATDRELAIRSHSRWVLRMSGKGWTHGKEKDPAVKTHPCLVKWEELPETDQVKTLQAVAIAKVHLQK